MGPEDLVGKKIELTKTCKGPGGLNTFKAGTKMRVISVYRHNEGIILRDRMRPDIVLVLGPSELKYCHIIYDTAHCHVCGKVVTSRNGKDCPDCGRQMWELIARQAQEQQPT